MNKVEKAITNLKKVADLNAVVTECKLKSTNLDNELLLDMPIVVKDNISTKGVKTTGSSKFLENYICVFKVHQMSPLYNYIILLKSCIIHTFFW